MALLRQRHVHTPFRLPHMFPGESGRVGRVWAKAAVKISKRSRGEMYVHRWTKYPTSHNVFDLSKIVHQTRCLMRFFRLFSQPKIASAMGKKGASRNAMEQEQRREETTRVMVASRRSSPTTGGKSGGRALLASNGENDAGLTARERERIRSVQGDGTPWQGL